MNVCLALLRDHDILTAVIDSSSAERLVLLYSIVVVFEFVADLYISSYLLYNHALLKTLMKSFF